MASMSDSDDSLLSDEEGEDITREDEDDDDEDLDDEDEDDYDDEEEEVEVKRRKHRPNSGFVLEEADVDDDYEDDEEAEKGYHDLIETGDHDEPEAADLSVS
ncbi:transcription elongation factor SPT5-like [Exaiptasia diaphana]|uniref:Uncharacterized protein n=1 Tax=Exaiptasia diaphana TaxID=2652724 RepID=A0A913X2C8_EXADI|nr:transcription elongation factor SPT5-like [Exaiptasia diaphana]